MATFRVVRSNDAYDVVQEIDEFQYDPTNRGVVAFRGEKMAYVGYDVVAAWLEEDE